MSDIRTTDVRALDTITFRVAAAGTPPQAKQQMLPISLSHFDHHTVLYTNHPITQMHQQAAQTIIMLSEIPTWHLMEPPLHLLSSGSQ